MSFLPERRETSLIAPSARDPCEICGLVDTNVWSLALRRDHPEDSSEVRALVRAVEVGDHIVTTGLVLQELLQGFSGPKDRDQIIDRFASFPLIIPDREDHIGAAVLRALCRNRGVQIGTIDALLAQLCVRHDLMLLTTDQDFGYMAKHCELRLWTS